MASFDDLTERTLNRFKDVENIDVTDVQDWVEMALNEHGFDKSDNVPATYKNILLIFAEAEGASRIALQTAYYFSFVDKDESVDKSMVSDNYRKLADGLWSRYRKMVSDGVGDIGGSNFKILKRADRR